MSTTVTGFGRSAISVITNLHSLFGVGVPSCASVPVDRHASIALGETSSLRFDDAFDTVSREIADFVMIVVDPDDADAVRDATNAARSSRIAGSYLVVALCSEPAMSDRLDSAVQSATLHALRAGVDSVVMVKTGSQRSNHAHVARVAYTLVSATLGHRANLLGLDLGDLKEALRGWAVATVTRTDLSDTTMTADTPEFNVRIDFTSTLAGNPRGLFCSYGAPPDRLRLEDFESVGSVIHEALQRAYPMHDVTIVPACLADSSLDHASEVVTCLAFDV